MCINQREKMILDYIKSDMVDKSYSTLTNDEISKELNLSFTTTRDKIHNLVKKGYLQRVINHWSENGEFHNRVLYKGILTK